MIGTGADLVREEGWHTTGCWLDTLAKCRGGLLNGGGISQLGIQALGAGAYALWTVVTCFVAWKLIGGFFGGIRVSEAEEIQGLDIGEHGMEAYPDFASS